ncbi:MAG: ethylbenzene dehydrogenase-related protein [Pseudomonadota bacterium]
MSPQLFRKTDAPTVFLHWALFATLVVSLLTGLRIGADRTDAAWARWLDPILLQGNVIVWHAWAATALGLVTIAYVIFLARSRLARRVALDAPTRRALRTGPADRRWRAANVALYWLAFALIAAAVATGLLLYALPGLLPFLTVAWIHQLLAWSLIVYVAIHVAGQLLAGGWPRLIKIISPRLAYGTVGALSVGVAGAAMAAVVVMDRMAGKTLTVGQVAEAPTLDGRADDPGWRNADTITIDTARGVNTPEGEPVTVRMVHDGASFYALFQWPDTTRSQKHLPLIKTEAGWKIMQSEYGIQDEDTYYEDKFGVMLAATPELAGAGTSHLGGKPLEDHPAPSGGRGLHYTTDGSIVDVWHWKSVRTGSFEMIDDNHFGPPMEVDPEKSRYTGGYTQDPKEAGGYKMNWESFSDDIVTPTHLPRDPTMIAAFQEWSHHPDDGDPGPLALRIADAVPYSAAADDYPVGTIMPSVLIDGPYEGDRGEVAAVAEWRDGMWTLEAKRALVTGSEYDMALTPDAPLYMWVAVFNHTQTRHSQHLHPVEIRME